MGWVARRCFPTAHSSWVSQFIQGCNGEFAVQFKHYVHHRHGITYRGVPGVVCWYPKAPARYFDLAITWPSAGHFVHQFLDKVQPYQIIANPCPAQACPGDQVCAGCAAVPAKWQFTISGVSSVSPPPPDYCSGLNGTWITDAQVPGPCQWFKYVQLPYALVGFEIYGPGYGDNLWHLTVSYYGLDYTLDPSVTPFNCLGANVLSGPGPDAVPTCQGYPATITIQPAP